MKHQSFDIHLFRNRTGQWSVSFTTASGKRTFPIVLNECELAMLRTVAGRMVPVAVHPRDLPWLRNEEPPVP